MITCNVEKTHSLEITLEVLDRVSAGDVWRDHVHVVHVGYQLHCGSAADSTAPCQQQRSTGGGEHAVHPSHVFQHLVEDEDVQLVVLTT